MPAELLSQLRGWIEAGDDEPAARTLLGLARIEERWPGVRDRVSELLHGYGREDVATWVRHCVKRGYVSRPAPEYFHDVLADSTGITHQPDVYPVAAHLARHLGCRHVIDIGCGTAGKLAALQPEFSVVGIDYGANIERCRRNLPSGTWIEWDLEQDAALELDPRIVRDAVVVCSDVIEHLKNPAPLLNNLRRLLEHAPLGVVSTPERDRVRGPAHMGPPDNLAHVREWNLAELRRLCETHGIDVGFSGLTVNNDRDLQKKTSLLVLDGSGRKRIEPVPHAFRVVALMTCYNEADILGPSIERLIAQGIEVYVVDNWSDDGSFEIARGYQGRGLAGLERFPAAGPSSTYDWHDLLGRVETLAGNVPADWFIHHDVDERRSGPWSGVDLRESIWRVDREGFSAIDHSVLVFYPIDEGFVPGTDFEDYFRHFEFGGRPGHFSQVKAWKRTGAAIRLSPSGGHDCRFDGRRVYPFKFLLKHYPVRGQAHGERKVLRERVGRRNAEEYARGWHRHYDGLAAGHRFLRSKAELQRFDPGEFFDCNLTERLTGVGIVRSGHPLLSCAS